MHGLQMCPGALEIYRLLYMQGRLCKLVIHKCIVNIHVHALSCLGHLAPRGAVVARHDVLPHQLSPLLTVVCSDLRTVLYCFVMVFRTCSLVIRSLSEMSSIFRKYLNSSDWILPCSSAVSVHVSHA